MTDDESKVVLTYDESLSSNNPYCVLLHHKRNNILKSVRNVVQSCSNIPIVFVERFKTPYVSPNQRCEYFVALRLVTFLGVGHEQVAENVQKFIPFALKILSHCLAVHDMTFEN